MEKNCLLKKIQNKIFINFSLLLPRLYFSNSLSLALPELSWKNLWFPVRYSFALAISPSAAQYEGFSLKSPLWIHTALTHSSRFDSLGCARVNSAKNQCIVHSTAEIFAIFKTGGLSANMNGAHAERICVSWKPFEEHRAHTLKQQRTPFQRRFLEKSLQHA